MNDNFTGAWLSSDILKCRELSGNEKILWSQINSLSKKGTGCYASNEYFCEILGVEPRTIKRMISKLKKLGYLEKSLQEGSKRILIPINNFKESVVEKTKEPKNDTKSDTRGCQKCPQGVTKLTPGGDKIDTPSSSAYMYYNKEENKEENKDIIHGATAPTAPKARKKAPTAPLRSCAVNEDSEKDGEELIVYSKKSTTTEESDISTDAIPKHKIFAALRKKGYSESEANQALYVYSQTLKPVQSLTGYLIGILQNKTPNQMRTYANPNPKMRSSDFRWIPNPERTAPELFR